MNRITLILFLFVFSGCLVFKGGRSSRAINSARFIEISHGIYTAEDEEIEVSKKSPLGLHTYVQNVKLLITCDTVIGKIGENFGVEYMIKTPKDTTLLIKKVWEFPSVMNNEKGEKYERLERELTIDTNAKLFSSYVFDKDFEILKGNWILKFYYCNNLVYKKEFVIK